MSNVKKQKLGLLLKCLRKFPYGFLICVLGFLFSERETETLNRARQLVFNNDNLAAPGPPHLGYAYLSHTIVMFLIIYC